MFIFSTTQLEWAEFVTVVKQNRNRQISQYHKLFDVPEAVSNEVNDTVLRYSRELLGKDSMRSQPEESSSNWLRENPGTVNSTKFAPEKEQAVGTTKVRKPGCLEFASTTTQTRTPQLPHTSRNTNPNMSKSSGVIHTTSVSRPQLKCYQVKDKVVPNNSQVKFQKNEVKTIRRISSIYKKQKTVTSVNDSSKLQNINVNAVVA
ncbi:hypothetical protein Tco_0526535 [Tanacetum coccineum]